MQKSFLIKTPDESKKVNTGTKFVQHKNQKDKTVEKNAERVLSLPRGNSDCWEWPRRVDSAHLEEKHNLFEGYSKKLF